MEGLVKALFAYQEPFLHVSNCANVPVFVACVPLQGYAPIREAQEDFYQRRMFTRIRVSWEDPVGCTVVLCKHSASRDRRGLQEPTAVCHLARRTAGTAPLPAPPTHGSTSWSARTWGTPGEREPGGSWAGQWLRCCHVARLPEVSARAVPCTTCQQTWPLRSTTIEALMLRFLVVLYAPALCSGVGELKLLGTTRHCLNLGSYNYLGFAASDPYCTPRVLDTMEELGTSTCSARGDSGQHGPLQHHFLRLWFIYAVWPKGCRGGMRQRQPWALQSL